MLILKAVCIVYVLHISFSVLKNEEVFFSPFPPSFEVLKQNLLVTHFC